MSGGSYEYFCYKVEEFTHDLKLRNCPKRIAFRDLMVLIAKACREIEWVDSGDNEYGHEHKSIDDVFNYLKNDSTMIYKAAAFDEIKKIIGEEYGNDICDS